MIAALPMYDRPEIRSATDAYWQAIRAALSRRGIDAPAELRRGDDDLMPQWTAPDLLMSQTCGFPYRARLHPRVTLIGTPDYGLPGCPPGHYRSVFIARADDPRPDLPAFDRATLAYNDPMSQSGWAAPNTHAGGLGLHLRPGPRTGSHAASLVAVAEGRADLAALDALTWALLAPHHLLAAAVRVIGQTDPTPGLPYITAKGRDPLPLFAAIAEAIAGLDEGHRNALHLRSIVHIPPESYLSVPTPAAAPGDSD